MELNLHPLIDAYTRYAQMYIRKTCVTPYSAVLLSPWYMMTYTHTWPSSLVIIDTKAGLLNSLPLFDYLPMLAVSQASFTSLSLDLF